MQRTRYQEKVIKNYYQNLDAIALARLGDLVGELYLAEGKKRETVWKRITGAMEKLKIPPSQIEHLRKQDKPELLAKLVSELMGKK